MKDFEARKALEHYMRGQTTLDMYAPDELNEMLTAACAGDLSKPARRIARYLHCTGNLPARRRFLVG